MAKRTNPLRTVIIGRDSSWVPPNPKTMLPRYLITSQFKKQDFMWKGSHQRKRPYLPEGFSAQVGKRHHFEELCQEKDCDSCQHLKRDQLMNMSKKRKGLDTSWQCTHSMPGQGLALGICQEQYVYVYNVYIHFDSVHIPYLAKAQNLEGGKFIDSEDSLVYHLVHKPQSAKFFTKLNLD